MKYLIKKIFKSNIIINYRNLLNLRPVKINTNQVDKNFSISDSFPWRTDINYSTIFRYKDLLNFFYNESKKKVDINFFSKKGILIKKIENYNLNSENEIIINKEFMDGVEDYGTFSIYHKSDNKKISIRNSCYTGFSFKQKSYVFVHGNVPTSAKEFEDHKSRMITGIIGKSLFKNQTYKIQNSFDDSDFTELFIHNPCATSIRVQIDNDNFSLNKNSSKIYKLRKKEITIKSNCYLLRPIIFNYEKDTVDVFHG